MQLGALDAFREFGWSIRQFFKGRTFLLAVPFVATYTFLIGIMILIGSLVGAAGVDLGPADKSSMAYELGFLSGVGALVVVFHFAYAWTLTAADSVWGSGKNLAFDRGFMGAFVRTGQLLALSAIMILVAIVSAITLVGPLIALALWLYGSAFVVISRQNAIAAVASAFQQARSNIWATTLLPFWFMALVGLTWLAIVLIARALLSHISVLAPQFLAAQLLAEIVIGVAFGIATLSVARFFRVYANLHVE